MSEVRPPHEPTITPEAVVPIDQLVQQGRDEDFLERIAQIRNRHTEYADF